MACSDNFVQYILDQTSEAGSIHVRKMFGDYGLYCDGKIVGLICDDLLFLKVTDQRPFTQQSHTPLTL